MPLPDKKQRDSRQKGSIAEEFKLEKEDAFKPTLEHIYWANPNQARGHISRCSYTGAHGQREVKETQGI
jgi:hypothetical protein